MIKQLPAEFRKLFSVDFKWNHVSLEELSETVTAVENHPSSNTLYIEFAPNKEGYYPIYNFLLNRSSEEIHYTYRDKKMEIKISHHNKSGEIYYQRTFKNVLLTSPIKNTIDKIFDKLDYNDLENRSIKIPFNYESVI